MNALRPIGNRSLRCSTSCVHAVVRIIDWPCIVLLGLCAALLAGLLVAAVAALFTSPEPTTTPVTVQFGHAVLEWHEDRANHVKSLSC